MNKKIAFLFIICSLFLFVNPALAQKGKKKTTSKIKEKQEKFEVKTTKNNNKKRDISYYFDDGGISNPYNLVKTNPFLPYVGDVPLYYERRLARFASIEVGAGYQLPRWKPDLQDLINGDSEGVPNPISGYSIYVNPRIYLSGNGLQGAFIGFAYRQRNMLLEPENNLFFTDYAVNYGVQNVFWGRFSYEYNIGLGVRNYKQIIQSTPNSSVGDSRGILPVHLKIGYLF